MVGQEGGGCRSGESSACSGYSLHPAGIISSNPPTTRSSPTTLGSSTGCARCADRQPRTAEVVMVGHALIQKVHRGHDNPGIQAPAGPRVCVAGTA